MKSKKVIFCLLGVLLLAFSVAYAQERDVEGSKDHPLVSRFYGSVIKHYEARELGEYVLPLGKLDETRKLTKSQQLEGKITRIQYKSPEGRSTLEIFRNYELALKKAGFEILFTGTLGDLGWRWTGKLYEDINPLVGDAKYEIQSEEDFRYLSAKLSHPEGDVFVSLCVSLGLFEPTTQLDVIEVEPTEIGLIAISDPVEPKPSIEKTKVESLIAALKAEELKEEKREATDVILGPNTKVLSSNALDNHVKTEGTIYYFNAAATEIGDLQVGDIIISSRGEGFLRKVTSVNLVGGQYIVDTTDTTLEEAFEKLHISFEITLTPADVVIVYDRSQWLKKDVDTLIQKLKDEDSLVRMWAAITLGEIGDPRAVEHLIAALKDEDLEVRRGAARALGEMKIGDPRAIEILIAALKDDGAYWIRKDAAAALGKIGDPRAVEPLIAALKDEIHRVRGNAAAALGMIGDPRAVEPLIAALKDDGDLWGWGRRGAARALGKIGDPRAVEPLIAALKDENSGVRWFARDALKKITRENFGKDHAKWQEWWEKNKTE